VPAFATWDGHIKPETVVNQPLHMLDCYPTLLKLAGATLEQKLSLDGRDAWPTIADGKPSPHEEILLNATPTNGAIRVGDWKLVLNGHRPDGGGEGEPQAKAKGKAKAKAKAALDSGRELVELFNLADDPY